VLDFDYAFGRVCLKLIEASLSEADFESLREPHILACARTLPASHGTTMLARTSAVANAGSALDGSPNKKPRGRIPGFFDIGR